MKRRQSTITACLFLLVTGLQMADSIAATTGAELEGLHWAFTYTDDGQLAGWHGPGGKGASLEYERDANQRLTKLTQTRSDGTVVSYEFDRFGRRAGMTDAFGSVRYVYDGYNRLTAVQRKGVPTLLYGYDALDRVTSVSVGKDFKIQYRYDFLGRLASQETPVGTIAYRYYPGQGSRIRTLPNGVTTQWKYGPDGRLTELTHATPKGAILARFRYRYRPDGLIESIEEYSRAAEHTLTYEYDTSQRLTAVDDSKHGRTEYRYDSLGNRTALLRPRQPPVTSVYDWAGRLTRHKGQACHHDQAANLTGCDDDKARRTFRYDDANRLRQTASPRGRVRYYYDGDGNLIIKAAGQSTTSFLPDPRTGYWRPLLMSRPDTGRTYFIWEGDTPLAAITGGRATFFLQDHLGSVRYRVNRNTIEAVNASADAFGEPDRPLRDSALQPAFAGLFYDPDTGIYLTKARAYDPRWGRFLQRDPNWNIPTGSQEDLSTYVYAADDPANRIDITGQQSYTYEQRRGLDYIPGGLSYVPQSSACGTYDSCRLWVRDIARSSASAYSGPITLSIPSVVSTTGPWIALQSQTAQALGAVGQAVQNRIESHYSPGWTSGLPGTMGIPGFSVFLPFLSPKLLSSYPGTIPAMLIVETVMAAKDPTTWQALNAVRQTTSSYANMGVHFHWLPSMMHYMSEPADRLASWISGQLSSSNMRNTYSGPPPIPTQPPPGTTFSPTPTPTQTTASGWSLTPTPTPGSVPTATFQSRPTPTPSYLSGPATPSNVGGIYLAGAGKALESLGPLSGIALDEKTGRLILISDDKGAIDLPPLRLDDVVTVFRTVYEGGGAPFVSIDPNPSNPRGKKMLVRHDEYTKDTYVGWVLFEADRVMKAYSLGKDNITRAKVSSSVTGYKNLLDPAFADSDTGTWERFWILPVSVQRLQATDNKLTLFDVPLKIETQPMQLENGVLEPAEGVEPSAGAKAFSRWFTDHYDAIGLEVRSQPPAESGIDTPVPVYTELRGIALSAAIAEKLREQGVPFPAWMRERVVRPVPVPPTTPAIVAKRSHKKGSYIVTRQIYGGVNLAPLPEEVHEVQDPRLDGMQTELRQTMAQTPLLEPVRLHHDGNTYRALALPGEGFRDVGGNSLSERDLVVPLPGDASIELVRRFHSFFRPSDVFGGSWTLDLPLLQIQRDPVERTEEQITYRQVFQLGSPLETWSARFSHEGLVPELRARLLVPDHRQDEILGLGDLSEPRIGQQTHVVFFRDGRRWHFDDEGKLVAREQTPLLVRYTRDREGGIQRIEGWYGASDKPSACIELTYDSSGRLARATGSNGEQVVYTYDKSGLLRQVDSPSGVLSYDYAEGLVTGIAREGKPLARFSYNQRGQLQSSWRADAPEVSYRTSADAQGISVTATDAATGKALDTTRYDPAFHPISRELGDGTRVDWKPAEGGSATETIRLPNGNEHVIVQTPDGKPIRWQLPEGGTYALTYDDGGRVTAINKGDRPVLQEQWYPDGRLAMAVAENSAERFQYREDNTLDRVRITPATGSSSQPWLQVDYDDSGRTDAITDYSGMNLRMAYDDKTGQLATLATTRDGQQQALEINRNSHGNLESLTTTWGYRQENRYSKNGEVSRIEVRAGSDQAVIELAQGRPSKLKQFDGGEWTIAYKDGGKAAEQLQSIRTPSGLRLDYSYDESGRLSAVAVGQQYEVQYGYDAAGRLAAMRQVPAQR